MTSIDAFPPGLVLILGAFLLPFLRGTLRNAWILLLPVFVLWLVWRVPDGPVLTFAFLDNTLTPVKGDVLSRLFAIIFAIMAFAGALTMAHLARMARAAPVISSTFSPLTLRAMRKPPICAGVASPDMMTLNAAWASSADKSSFAANLAIGDFRSVTASLMP